MSCVTVAILPYKVSPFTSLATNGLADIITTANPAKAEKNIDLLRLIFYLPLFLHIRARFAIHSVSALNIHCQKDLL